MLELRVRRARYQDTSIIELLDKGEVVAAIYPEGDHAFKIEVDYQRIETAREQFTSQKPVIVIEPRQEKH